MIRDQASIEVKAPSVNLSRFQKRVIDSSFEVIDNFQKFKFNQRLAEAKLYVLKSLKTFNDQGLFSPICLNLAKNIVHICERLQIFSRTNPIGTNESNRISSILTSAQQELSSMASASIGIHPYASLPSSSKVYENELLDLMLANAAFKLKYDTDQ